MTKRYRKKITVVLSLVLPVILLFAILNCFTTYVFYEDYKYKMNLMTEIAAKEEFSGLDAVSELLKNKDIETNEQGRQLLEQYGYWGNKGNACYLQFRHQVMVTGAVSIESAYYLKSHRGVRGWWLHIDVVLLLFTESCY